MLRVEVFPSPQGPYRPMTMLEASFSSARVSAMRFANGQRLKVSWAFDPIGASVRYPVDVTKALSPPFGSDPFSDIATASVELPCWKRRFRNFFILNQHGKGLHAR